MRSSTLAPVAIDYPTEDGLPMAETDAQGIPLMYAVTGLRDFFRHRRDVYVSGNLLIYYEEGNPDASVAPDVFVVMGVPNHIRPIYKVWEERKGPDFVLEIASRNTWQNDQGPKRELYESLGVKEYWQYDPTGDYLESPLSGVRLVGREYEPLEQTRLADGVLAMYSAVLGLELCIVEGDVVPEELRFHDPATGQNILTLTESNEGRRRAEQACQREKQARQEAEAGRQAAETSLEREAMARQAAEEAQQQAETRVAELEALLRRERGRD